MARALRYVNQQLTLISQQNIVLTETVVIQNQQITEMKLKVSYGDTVLNCIDLISASTVAKDHGKSVIWMNQYLYEMVENPRMGRTYGRYISVIPGRVIPTPRLIPIPVRMAKLIRMSSLFNTGIRRSEFYELTIKDIDLDNRPTALTEMMIDGYIGFLFRDKNGMTEVAMYYLLLARVKFI